MVSPSPVPAARAWARFWTLQAILFCIGVSWRFHGIWTGICISVNCMTAWAEEQGCTFVWSCWASNHPPSCSRQENICKCLPYPTHKNKWTKQSRTAPKCNCDRLFMSQNLKKCWIVLYSWERKKKEEPVLGQIYRADYAHGCLACGMLLSIFVAPADFSPISMFYGLPNVFPLQKSVLLATLALTPLLTPCCFSECMYSLCRRVPWEIAFKNWSETARSPMSLLLRFIYKILYWIWCYILHPHWNSLIV